MITIRRGAPARELPTLGDVTPEDVATILDPEAKDVPELRPNTWLAEQRANLEAIDSAGDPRERAPAQARYAFSLCLRDAPAAYQLSEEALRTGTELDDAEITATANLALGWSIWNRENDGRKIVDYAVEAEYLFHDLGLRVWEAQAMLPRVLAAWFAASYSTIPPILESISELLAEPADGFQEHVRLRTYASVCRLRALLAGRGPNTADTVNGYLALAVSFARVAPEPLFVGYCHNMIGSRLLADGRCADARRHFTRYGLIARRNDTPIDAFDSIQLIAHTYTREKRFHVAHDLLAEADQRAAELPYLPRLTRLRLDGARIDLLMEQRRWDAAEALLTEAMPTVENSPRANLIVTLKWLIRVYREQDTLTEHLDVFDRLLEETERMADERSAMQMGLANTQRETERRKSEKRAAKLLRGILPDPVYRELVDSGESAPRYYPDAVVFFSDFAGFTRIASALTPRQVIEELSELFNNFDSIMARHDCHRIETIGDAYLAVGEIAAHGEPDATDSSDAALALVRAALEIRAYLAERNRTAEVLGGPQFIARIGIHAGPIIGGVVGRDRIRYGIFGDAVNTAKRLEEACEPGSVLVSQSVHGRITGITAADDAAPGAADLTLAPRGTVHAKGKGELPVWTVEHAPARYGHQ